MSSASRRAAVTGHSPELHVVTGAFSYTGKHIASRLLATGHYVRTLTGHPDRPHSFGSRVSVAALDFANPPALVESMRGASVLYNTYWVRFPHERVTFQKAIENSKILIEAAMHAGIRRVVHLSVTNASKQAPLPYFDGKGVLEEFVRESVPSYAIIRPTLVFGHGDILLNNIAWLLRRFPAFAIPGSGEYRLQPIFVEDVAEIAVQAGQDTENTTVDAAGPEQYSFKELVQLIATSVKSRAKLIHVSPRLALSLLKLIGYAVHDVILTLDEMQGLMENLLVPTGAPEGQTPLSQWLEHHKDSLGARYASELERYYRRCSR